MESQEKNETDLSDRLFAAIKKDDTLLLHTMLEGPRQSFSISGDGNEFRKLTSDGLFDLSTTLALRKLFQNLKIPKGMCHILINY